MDQNPYQKLSPTAALDSYKHIDLTPDEMDEAILLAKQKKERKLQDDRMEQVAAENRRKLAYGRWTFDQIKEYMLHRAKILFEGRFSLDDNNKKVFDLLCYYFSEDAGFEAFAKGMDIKEPSLGKGLMLVGGYGVGKTWLLKLFMKNQRQTYWMRSAKDIANGFQKGGEEYMDQYLALFNNAANDPETFYQKHPDFVLMTWEQKM